MQRISLLPLPLLFVCTFALACEAVVSSPWYILDKKMEPVAIKVFETDRHAKLELVYFLKTGKKQFDLDKPSKESKWVYGTCTNNKQADQAIFAVVKKQDSDGWAKSVVAAYRVNLDTNSIDKVPVKKILCFTSTQ